MKWMAVAVAVAAFGAAQAAWAGPLPDGGVTAAEVRRELLAKGYRAEIKTDKEGDPMIESGADGSNFKIYFYSCKDGGRCTSIQFAAAFDLKSGMTYADLNTWNRKKRFGRAYLDDEMDPFVEFDVDFEHGATTEAVANVIDTWAAVLPAFKQHIDF